MTQTRAGPLHVSLVAVPDALLGPVSGIYEALNSFPEIRSVSDAVPKDPPFDVDIVSPSRSLSQAASGMALTPHRTLGEVTSTDIVIVPAMFVEDGVWRPGRYPEVVDWLAFMHGRGARVCSACSGALLVAETGLLDGRDATVHWALARTFRRNFPGVRLRVDQMLVIAGARDEIVMSGGSAGWHDLLLYLVAATVGPTVAQVLSKVLLFPWHPEGQAPYVTFLEPTDHGDRVVRELQVWLRKHYAAVNPVGRMQARAGLTERSFKRRFKLATGMPPLEYVQRLRVEEAKRRLERTTTPVDEVSVAVGYENPAFFRRLFKRIAGLSPSAYRRRFQLPGYAGIRA